MGPYGALGFASFFLAPAEPVPVPGVEPLAGLVLRMPRSHWFLGQVPDRVLCHPLSNSME